MFFMVRFPDGFVPEEYGWEVMLPIGKWGERERTEEDTPMWRRRFAPFKEDELLSQCLGEGMTGAVGGVYVPLAGLLGEAEPYESVVEAMKFGPYAQVPPKE